MAAGSRLYGLYSFAGGMIGHIPSQRLRRSLYRRVFHMEIAADAAVYGGLRFRRGRGIVIGDGSSVGHRCELDGRGGLRIGRNVNVSSEAMLWTAQHDYRRPGFATVFAPIEVQDWVWIGPRVIVLPGVTIEEGCVVAAGSVVTRSTTSWGVYAGIPARRIGERSQDTTGYVPAGGYVPFI